MGLDAKFKSKAEAELREDDLRKEQALSQFREWLQKQGHIKNCRTDDNFLLRFLRAKKYNITKAFTTLETFLVRCQMYPQWFKRVSIFDDERIRELYDTGYIFPLIERDQNGCRVIFIETKKLDPSKFTFAEVLKVVSFIVFTLLEEEETQIAGISYVIDYKDLTMEHLALFSIMDLKHFLDSLTNAVPVRNKLAIVVDLPSIGSKFFEIVLGFLSKKLRERFQFRKRAEVCSVIDPKILPLEYGGGVSSKEMMDHFKKIAKERLEKLRAIDETIVDAEFIKKHASDFDSDAGSFRKLEVD